MKTVSKMFEALCGAGLIVLFSLAAINHAGAQTCIQPPPDMTSWWPGDGNTNDIVGGRNAVLKNGAAFGVGQVGQGFILDGIDDFVDVPHHPALNVGTGDFTVDLWVFFNDTAGEQVLVEKYVEQFGPTTTGWTFTKHDDNRLTFSSADSGPLSLPTNTWIHFAARRSGDVATIFMNGTLVATGSPVDRDNGDSNSSLKFGHRGSPDDTPGSTDDRGFFLNGRIDEVELFVGGALSDAEIQAIFNAGSAGKCKVSTGLDHFKCYKAKGEAPNVAVNLEDQFGVEPGVLVKKPELFCNPVDTNREGIRNPAAHLTCYKIKADGEKRDVVATNQFGEQTLEVKKPTLLCVPSEKVDVIPEEE